MRCLRRGEYGILSPTRVARTNRIYISNLHMVIPINLKWWNLIQTIPDLPKINNGNPELMTQLMIKINYSYTS